MYELIHGNCLKVLFSAGYYDCIFADPPDNINLPYGTYKDKIPKVEYLDWLERCLEEFHLHTSTIWLSFNSYWTFAVGEIFQHFFRRHNDWRGKTCVQTFTFGNYNPKDLTNGHRPLWCLKKIHTPIYPEQILEPSWRLQNGDKRADPAGRVPSDVFDFPRVTGNSTQRRDWHPTQLNEQLVKRCILFSTREGEHVLDPFAGTGTTLRVCQQLKRKCTLIELDAEYCRRISIEHNLQVSNIAK